MRKYLIWSIEHHAWWRPARNGYTIDRAEAGQYSFEDATAICNDANVFIKNTPQEAMVPIHDNWFR